VRGTALRIGVDPRESECDALVDELLMRDGYLENLPQARPLAPTGSVATHRAGHRLSRGELDSSSPKAREPSEFPAWTLLRPCPH
jgi:hypothetical protein